LRARTIVFGKKTTLIYQDVTVELEDDKVVGLRLPLAADETID